MYTNTASCTTRVQFIVLYSIIYTLSHHVLYYDGPPMPLQWLTLEQVRCKFLNFIMHFDILMYINREYYTLPSLRPNFHPTIIYGSFDAAPVHAHSTVQVMIYTVDFRTQTNIYTLYILMYTLI